MTEAFVAIGLVSNIVQIIDFSSKLLSNSRELYRSSVGALAANVDIEAAATRLVQLNNKIRDSTSATSDDALKRLCESCSSTADELLAALNKVKAEGKKDKWRSIGKALRSVWAKERIAALEERLAKFRHELNLHVNVDLRKEVSKLTLVHMKRYNHLDMATQGILDAILKHQDVFEAVYETQAATIRTLHNEVVSKLETEHTTTRLKVVRETALIIEDENVRTRNVLQEIQLILQRILAPLTILLVLVSRLCASSQQIYDVLLEMRSTRFVDTRWRFFQAPYVLEDALGRVYPIPSEFDFDLIRTVIKANFQKAPGYRQVLLGNYELFSNRDTRKVISATTHIPPGTTISMAILLNTPSTGTDCCPIPGCRSTQCENRRGGGKICSTCNVWFDFSSTKRRSFSDVAPTIEASDYEWLADDLLRTSISDVPTTATASHQIGDVNAYRMIKLAVTDKLWDDENSLEVPLNDDMCIFNPAGQVALTRLDRDYRRGRLSADDLCYSLEASFRSMNPSKVTVKVKQGREQKLDEIVMIISSSSPAW